jgi:hypothetical protein
METQTFANHTRWDPPFHFFVMPVLMINFFWAIVVCVETPTANSGWWIVVSLALLLLGLFARINALRVQDRLIRLEEKLRYQQLLTPALTAQMSTLTPAQICALRFAGDEELEQLATQVVAGKFSRPKDIKQAVKSWRADLHRV